MILYDQMLGNSDVLVNPVEIVIMSLEQRRLISPKACFIRFGSQHSSDNLARKVPQGEVKSVFSLAELRSQRTILFKIKELTNVTRMKPMIRFNKFFRNQMTPATTPKVAQTKTQVQKVKTKKKRQFTKHLFDTWNEEGSFLPTDMRKELNPIKDISLSVGDIDRLRSKSKIQKLKGYKISRLVCKPSHSSWTSSTQEVFQHNFKRTRKVQLKNNTRYQTLDRCQNNKEFEISPWRDIYDQF